LATLVKSLALLGLATLCRAKLERPQEVVGLTEVRADSVDLVHKVLNAQDAVLAQALLNDSIVVERDSVLVDLTVSTLVDEVLDRLQGRVSVGQVRLDSLQHLSGSLGDLHEDTHVHRTKTHKLQNLLGLRVHVSETTDTDDEDELGLSVDEVVASSLGLTVHAHALLGNGAVLFDILLSRLVSCDTLLLALLPCDVSGRCLLGTDLLLGLTLFKD